MLDLKLEDIDGILVRYNVALEKEMTPDEAAEELYPKDELIYPVAKAIYEGEEDDVVDGLKAAIDAGKDPIALINDALMAVSYTHLRAHETGRNRVCRLLL
jgi:methanol corrinoid protein